MMGSGAILMRNAEVGTRLIDVMLDRLGASIHYEDANPGCRATVRIPQLH